uniref:Uncharacterized protein n=1 Tax=Meloidogyne javanica TaxID=6303 RepID=A0A915LXV4_MELJA
MKLLIIYLLFLFITSIVCPPKKHSRDSPKEDFDPNKRRSVSGSDTGTGTGTSNPDATTNTGVPSSQEEQQTRFFGLDEIFGNNPFLNQQEQQPLHSFDSSFPPYVHQSNLPGNSTEPLFTPPITPYGDYGSYHQVNPTLQGDYNQNPWPERSGPGGSVSQHGNPTGQADYTSINYPPSFSPLPFTPQSFWGHEHDHPTPSIGEEDLNQWLEGMKQIKLTTLAIISKDFGQEMLVIFIIIRAVSKQKNVRKPKEYRYFWEYKGN